MATVLGKAGGSSYGQAARAGAQGEATTATILNSAPPGVVVLHDLSIPFMKVGANIDHAIISGTTIWLVDSKLWQPGVYWTLGGKTFRGFKRFAVRNGSERKFPGDSRTMPMALPAFKKAIAGAEFATPIMVIHSSSRKGSVGLRFFRPQEATPMTGKKLARWILRLREPADASLVAMMRKYVRR